MPFVDLLSKEDYSSIHYITNTSNGNVGNFNPEKPTIIMLHPHHLDCSWLYPQFDDPRLRDRYNIIAFDTRVTGSSIYRFNGKYDLWVAAADIAHAIHYLGLPPAHFFACELFSLVVLRFAVLFPDLCLSMTLCNVPAQAEMKSVFGAYEEMCHIWGYAEDLETFEHINGALLSHVAAPKSSVDVQDELVAFWQTQYPPWRRSHIMASAQVLLNRAPLSATELAAIRAPTLIIQSDKNPLYPVQNAENLQSSLVNASGGVAIYSVKAETGSLSIFSASIVNQTFSKFLARQPRVRSDLAKNVGSCEKKMKVALERLAALKVDSTFLLRDPKSALSFSCHNEETAHAQDAVVIAYSRGQRRAWSPLGMDGRPLRKFSERMDHWLQNGADGYSYSVSAPEKKSKPKEEKKKSKSQTKSEPKVQPPPPPSSPPRPVVPPVPTVEVIETDFVSQPQQQLALLRRTMIDQAPHAIATEQQILKGSLSRVTSNHSSSMPLSRLVR